MKSSGAMAYPGRDQAERAFEQLAVDMFGAILTHAHNSDSINDDTGAIVMLLRLGVICLSWNLRRYAKRDISALRRSLSVVAISAVICFLAALGGSAAVRGSTVPVSVVRSVSTVRPCQFVRTHRCER